MADDCLSDSLLAVFVEDFSQVDTRRGGTIARHKVGKLLELHMQRSPSDEEITTALGGLPGGPVIEFASWVRFVTKVEPPDEAYPEGLLKSANLAAAEFTSALYKTISGSRERATVPQSCTWTGQANPSSSVECGTAATLKLTGSFTLMGWLRIDQYTPGMAATNLFGSAQCALRVKGDLFNPQYHFAGVKSTLRARLGDWEHIAVVYDAADKRINLVVNGRYSGEARDVTPCYAPDESIILGSQELDGVLRGVMVLDSVLSTKKVTELAAIHFDQCNAAGLKASMKQAVAKKKAATKGWFRKSVNSIK